MYKLLLITLSALPLSCNAVDWIDLGKSNNKRSQTFLDYDSVKRQDVMVYGGSSSFRSAQEESDYISAVVQLTYINDNPLRKKGFYYTKEQWFISCDDSTYFTKASIDYGFKDEVISSWHSNKNSLFKSDFSYAFPETVAGNVVEQACSSMMLKEIDSTGSYEEYLQKYVYNQ